MNVLTATPIAPLEPNYCARLKAALNEVRELEKTLVLLIDQRGAASMEVAKMQLRHAAEYLGDQ